LTDNNQKDCKGENTMGQLLSWILLIAPWFILIPLDSKRVKHFSSVIFFTISLTTIYWQVGEVWNWWTVPNNVFFLKNIASFTYGLFPVVTILVFYFTYKNVWLFFGTNIILDAFLGFIISPLVFERFGLYKLNNISNLKISLLALSLVPLIFLYQKWYEKE